MFTNTLGCLVGFFKLVTGFFFNLFVRKVDSYILDLFFLLTLTFPLHHVGFLLEYLNQELMKLNHCLQ
jgi:hypothetical protein